MNYDNTLLYACGFTAAALYLYLFSKIFYWKKIAEIQREISVKLALGLQSNDLILKTIDGYKMNSETIKLLVDDLKILNDRVAAYNHRLNELAVSQQIYKQ
jgi:hypothetical protein